MTLSRLKYVLLFIVFLLINNDAVFSQDCPELTPSGNKNIAYSKRDNRCEGFYVSKVSAGSLDMVSLVKGRFHYFLRNLDVIEVSSSVTAQEPMNVRAVGIPLKMYYRMDAKLAPRQILKWPLKDVIYRKKISPGKIGIFGWTGSEKKKTYIPVISTVKNPSGEPQEGVEQDEKIRLDFRPSVDVKTVQWRISQWTSSGCSHARPWKESEKSSYRSGQPITVELMPPHLSEICFEIAGWEASSGRWIKNRVHIRIE